ncbi:MAG: hypothetical protein HFH68_06385 [Lachnospiraceae bacterium]|nr:hypothetical protein [Lachnospiraceae bacterium]
MDTQNNFLDNAEDGKFQTDRTKELPAKMCSYMQGDAEEKCSSLCNDTCGIHCTFVPQITR